MLTARLTSLAILAALTHEGIANSTLSVVGSATENAVGTLRNRASCTSCGIHGSTKKALTGLAHGTNHIAGEADCVARNRDNTVEHITTTAHLAMSLTVGLAVGLTVGLTVGLAMGLGHCFFLFYTRINLWRKVKRNLGFIIGIFTGMNHKIFIQ